MKKIIFDLDGTLIDSSDRLFLLFKELVPECNFTKEEYWNFKRNKINHEKLLLDYFPTHSFSEFNVEWMSKIELDRFLQYDKNYSDTKMVLSILKKKYEIILLTARQNKSSVLTELKKLDILEYFDSINVCFNKEDFFINNKHLYNSYFVSDMGKDILLGEKYKLITIAIDHGFMSKEKLLEYNPIYIIGSLSELLGIV